MVKCGLQDQMRFTRWNAVYKIKCGLQDQMRNTTVIQTGITCKKNSFYMRDIA